MPAPARPTGPLKSVAQEAHPTVTTCGTPGDVIKADDEEDSEEEEAPALAAFLQQELPASDPALFSGLRVYISAYGEPERCVEILFVRWVLWILKETRTRFRRSNVTSFQVFSCSLLQLERKSIFSSCSLISKRGLIIMYYVNTLTHDRCTLHTAGRRSLGSWRRAELP